MSGRAQSLSPVMDSSRKNGRNWHEKTLMEVRYCRYTASIETLVARQGSILVTRTTVIGFSIDLHWGCN
jgi:hypothetical protein